MLQAFVVLSLVPTDVVVSHAVPIVKLHLRSMCPLRSQQSSTEACTHGQSQGLANENEPVVQTGCSYWPITLAMLQQMHKQL
jgi:hypothetical protein